MSCSRIFGLLGIAAVLILTGCSKMFAAKDAADKSVADFHRQLNQARHADIYRVSHANMKAATTEKDFVQLLGAVHRKLGKVTDTSCTGVNIQSHNLVTTVTLQQDTKFERGAGKESFTFQMAGTNAVLVGYNISSKELIIN